MYSVQYLRSKTTTKVPDPGPTTKLVGIIAQDSVQKKKKRKAGKKKKRKKKKRIDPH